MLRRIFLMLRMTLAYKGRFPKRKVWRLYWRFAGDMVASDQDSESA